MSHKLKNFKGKFLDRLINKNYATHYDFSKKAHSRKV